MLTISPSRRLQLRSDAVLEISEAHEKAWKEIVAEGTKRPQWEARFVARLCNAMVDVGDRWKEVLRSILPSARLSVASVFTHQRPYVKSSAGTCELADLLIAVVDNRMATPGGHAILIQAKQADDLITRIEGTAKKQFRLLSKRPTFDVLSSDPAPSRINLSKMPLPGGLLYGLTFPDKRPPLGFAYHRTGDSHWHTAWDLTSGPKYVVETDRCLADTLVDLLQGDVGWEFSIAPWATLSVSATDWSILINYLLQQTFGLALKSLGRFIRTGRRGVTHAMHLTTGPGLEFSTTDPLWGRRDSILRQMFADQEGNVPPGKIFDTQGNFPDQGAVSAVLIEIGERDGYPDE